MDRRALIAAAGVGLACGAAKAPDGSLALSRGALAYSAAVGERSVFVAELRTRFEVVAYRLDGTGERWRRDVGPADYDLVGIAASDERVWVASTDGVVRSYDVRSGTPGSAWALGASATGLAIANGSLLTATNTGVLCQRRLRDGALLQCLVAHPAPITDIDVRDDLVATAATDGSVELWRLPGLEGVATTRLSGAANAVAISPSGDVAVARGPGPLQRSPAIARREDERGFPSVDPRHAIVLWTPGQAGLRVLVGHRGAVTDLLWRRDGALLSSSWDRTVRRWRPGRPESRIVGSFPYLVRSLAGRGRYWVASVWARTPSGRSTELRADPSAPAD